jgi:flavodoxin
MPDTMRRRTLTRLGLGGAAAGMLNACGTDTPRTAQPDPTVTPPPARSDRAEQILLAYFSRPGENYWNGGRRNLKVGNTEVLAQAISARLDCDVHRIEPADPYPADYDETVERNVREQDSDARPEIANPLASIDDYDTILLASPISNVRAPMIMATFAERYDFTEKTVHPITTYAMSGLGTTPGDYARDCRGARIATGLAIRGEQARSAGANVDAWLRRTRLLDGRKLEPRPISAIHS